MEKQAIEAQLNMSIRLSASARPARQKKGIADFQTRAVFTLAKTLIKRAGICYPLTIPPCGDS
jgi:hypothetical protein